MVSSQMVGGNLIMAKKICDFMSLCDWLGNIKKIYIGIFYPSEKLS